MKADEVPNNWPATGNGPAGVRLLTRAARRAGLHRFKVELVRWLVGLAMAFSAMSNEI